MITVPQRRNLTQVRADWAQPGLKVLREKHEYRMRLFGGPLTIPIQKVDGDEARCAKILLIADSDSSGKA